MSGGLIINLSLDYYQVEGRLDASLSGQLTVTYLPNNQDIGHLTLTKGRLSRSKLQIHHCRPGETYQEDQFILIHHHAERKSQVETDYYGRLNGVLTSQLDSIRYSYRLGVKLSSTPDLTLEDHLRLGEELNLYGFFSKAKPGFFTEHQLWGLVRVSFYYLSQVKEEVNSLYYYLVKGQAIIHHQPTRDLYQLKLEVTNSAYQLYQIPTGDSCPVAYLIRRRTSKLPLENHNFQGGYLYLENQAVARLDLANFSVEVVKSQVWSDQTISQDFLTYRLLVKVWQHLRQTEALLPDQERLAKIYLQPGLEISQTWQELTNQTKHQRHFPGLFQQVTLGSLTDISVDW